MFQVNGDTGNIICRQGDSGDITFTGIDQSKNYQVYFSIYNNKRKIIHELHGVPYEGLITFGLTPEITDKLTVPIGEKTAIYDGVASDMSNKADKATTLAGYGITDGITWVEVAD